MAKWYLDPKQRAKFKRDYRRKTENDPAYIDAFAYVGDYCGVGHDAVPQITGRSPHKRDRDEPKRGRKSRELKWFEDNFAVIQLSRPINRDLHGKASDEQELNWALNTPEVFEIPDGHKLCLGPCGDVKPYELFDKKADAKDGYQSWCQNCNRERLARYQWERREAERLILQSEGRYRKPGRPSKAA